MRNCFSDTVFSSSNWNRINSKLMRAIELFLAVEDFQQDKTACFNRLFSVLVQKKATHQVSYVVKKLEQQFENTKEKDAHYYYQLYRMRKTQLKERGFHLRTYIPELQEAMDSLDQFYFAEKLCILPAKWPMLKRP